MTLDSGAKTFQANGCIRLGQGGKIVLNGTNAYWGSWSSSRSASLWLPSKSSGEQEMSYLDVNVYNKLDGFCFGTNKSTDIFSALTVTLGDGDGVILELTQISSTLDNDKGYLMGDAKLVFVNFRTGAVKVTKEHASKLVEGVTYADDFSLISAEGWENFRLEKDQSGDFFWLTATQVPEPATIASLLGVIALAVALRRSRKS